MAPTAKYIATSKRINEIEVNLLPPERADGAYNTKDYDLVRSYCLLCHAEFESYIESITLETVNKAFKKWLSDKQLISPIIFHLAFNYSNKIKDVPYSLVVKSYKEYEKTIKGNHGIKENNLNSFFTPIGFEMDALLKLSLTNFGGLRGEIAHTSFSTQQPLDPKTQKENVKQILNGLKAFDEELEKYESLGKVSRSPKSLHWRKYNLLERLCILIKGNL